MVSLMGMMLRVAPEWSFPVTAAACLHSTEASQTCEFLERATRCSSVFPPITTYCIEPLYLCNRRTGFCKKCGALASDSPVVDGGANGGRAYSVLR